MLDADPDLHGDDEYAGDFGIDVDDVLAILDEEQSLTPIHGNGVMCASEGFSPGTLAQRQIENAKALQPKSELSWNDFKREVESDDFLFKPQVDNGNTSSDAKDFNPLSLKTPPDWLSLGNSSDCVSTEKSTICYGLSNSDADALAFSMVEDGNLYQSRSINSHMNRDGRKNSTLPGEYPNDQVKSQYHPLIACGYGSTDRTGNQLLSQSSCLDSAKEYVSLSDELFSDQNNSEKEECVSLSDGLFSDQINYENTRSVHESSTDSSPIPSSKGLFSGSSNKSTVNASKNFFSDSKMIGTSLNFKDIITNKREHDVYKGSNHSVERNPFRSYIENDSDVCILDDITDHLSPSVPPVLTFPKPVTQYSGVSNHYSGIGGLGVKPPDERLSLQKALQDMSQPMSEASPPDGLLAVPLMRHQRISLSWMVHKETASSNCCGGILADDQGLGKTISTIALILTERSPSSKSCSMLENQEECEPLNLDDDDEDTGIKESCSYMSNAMSWPVKKEMSVNVVKGRPQAGTLIVCPTSVLRQWADELHNKVTRKGNLSYLIYHGSNRTKDPNELAKYDVVLTTYAIVTMEVPMQPLVDKEVLRKKDEGAYLKKMYNSTTKKRKITDSKNNKSESFEFVRPLGSVGWFRVVLDEAQSIKNHRTKAARSCWGLRAKRRWCLSGTPIQNSIDDLYSYFRFLRFEPYEKYDDFCLIKKLINQRADTGYKKLQAVLKMILLRRTKSTLLDGKPIIILPPKTISLQKVKFSNEEHMFYKALEANSQEQFKIYENAGTVQQNYCNILVMLLRLRQACDHHLLVRGHESVSNQNLSLEKANKLTRDDRIKLSSCLEASLAICGICNDAPEDSVVTICGHVFCNQCILEHLTVDENICPSSKCTAQLSIASVFSKSTLERSLSEQLGTDGQIKNENDMCEDRPSYPLSSKLNAALEILKSLPKSGGSSQTHDGIIDLDSDSCSGSMVSEKAILFSQWTKMLDLLEAPLRSCSIQFRRLDGTMSITERQNAINDFKSRPEVTVMIMSLKAASLGLNMVAANHVILLDLWWNPTTEDQAIDRAHRIGQTRPVTVSRLTVENSVEDRILCLQQKKREMVASAFGEDGSGINQTRLTEEDLRYLFMV